MAKIKLSTAIRKGVEIKPKKVRFTFFEGIDKACALGAAFVGKSKKNIKFAECKSESAVNRLLRKDFPELKTIIPHGPTQDEQDFLWGRPSLRMIIEHMNDALGWSRQRIANWLEKRGY